MNGMRRAAVLEAWTLLLLFGVAMPLKYLAGVEQATSVMGPVHGLAFMVFLWFTIRSWAEGLFGWGGALRLILGAFVPGAGFVNERWLRRLDHGEDPDAV